jgi:hypothetical protein
LASNSLYERNINPFGKSWEEWAAVWYQWMASIPKNRNPCLDQSGTYASENQYDKNVWFLAGTFGNIKTVKRQCVIPKGKSILFPVLLKQDSFANDPDLVTEEQLINRAREATDRTRSLRVTINGMEVKNIEAWRARSPVFDLTFPIDNVYDVSPGPTRAVCDGFWVFIKPMQLGRYTIYFRGETLLCDETTIKVMKSARIYASVWPLIQSRSVFKTEVLYCLSVA